MPAILLLILASLAQASTAAGDTLYVSSIAGLATSNGVTISSYVRVSGSSLTLQGSGGYITSSSSITAASFWGDATNLDGISFLIATQTFSGANSFTSSLTIRSQGREIILSTDAVASNIRISTQGVLSFHPALHNSSSTIIPQFSTTNNFFGPCVSGSTLTISTSGGMVEIAIQAQVSISSDGICGSWWAGVNFLQDGQFVRNLNANNGPGYIEPAQCDSSGKSIRIRYLLDPPSNGPHSYCITISAPGGVHGTTIGHNTAANIFYIKELK